MINFTRNDLQQPVEVAMESTQLHLGLDSGNLNGLDFIPIRGSLDS